MQEQLRERLRLEEDLGGALERGEFYLEFQPVVDLTHRELLGVEALVRWNHPLQGIIMPAAFIPAAEESGRIIELGRWVLIEACRSVRAWRDSIVAGEGLRVAVNISGRHLQHADLVADVRHALETSGLEPENLVIELTESTIMHNTEVNLDRFRELKALGVRLAIDDFGMGYSSLSYLHRFPIDILKIDRSFVGRLTEQDDGPELARAVVMLVETAFSLNGMGSLLVQSVDKQDFAIVQAIVLIVVFAFVIINTIVDIAYPFIDPRVKAGSAAR
jgi:EAL domain-containing protein (putative c-di-GMP-specific phosphodiesterase class I)